MSQKQTVEMRSPDGSADLYQLLAGLAVACRHGFEIENALDIAEKTYVNVNIHQKENEDKLNHPESAFLQFASDWCQNDFQLPTDLPMYTYLLLEIPTLLLISVSFLIRKHLPMFVGEIVTALY